MINTWFKDFYVKVTYAARIDDCSQIKASHSPKPRGKEWKIYFPFENCIYFFYG